MCVCVCVPGDTGTHNTHPCKAAEHGIEAGEEVMNLKPRKDARRRQASKTYTNTRDHHAR